MTTLELMLRDAGSSLDWPPTPDLADAVARRIRDERPAAARAARRRFRMGRPLAIALAALLALSGGAAAIPGIREPVLEFLGLRSVQIERVPRLPPPGDAGDKLDVGRRTTLAGARAGLSFRPVVATALGDPQVYVQGFPSGGQLALVYDRGRLLLTAIRGGLANLYLRKFVPPDGIVEQVQVNGEAGVWIAGDVHEVVFADARGNISPERLRIAGNVLLWRRGDLLLRLEGAKAKRQALRIAASVRAAP